MVLIEACVRLLPGVIGAAQSLARESFEDDVLEYPHYTRPREWEGRHIPEVLLSGDHARIEEWRRAEALRPHAGPPTGSSRAAHRPPLRRSGLESRRPSRTPISVIVGVQRQYRS